jgi:signal transduction histidine kinase
MRKNSARLYRKGFQAVLEFSDRMERLFQFQEKVDFPANPDRIWEVLLTELKSLIAPDACALFLVDEESCEFVLRKAEPEGCASSCRREIDLQVECGIFSWVIQRRQPAVVPALGLKDGKSIVLIPLSTARRTMGAVLLFTRAEGGTMTGEILKLLGILGKQCALVMENFLLYDHVRREHESLLEAQAQVLNAEKLAAIGRLTSRAFHELLNPLNIISSHVEFLLMEDDLGDRIARYLGIIGDQSGRMAKILKEVLQFSRYPKPRTGEVRFNELIEGVLASLNDELKAGGIRVEKDFEQDLPSVLGDGEDLSRVVSNLVRNGRDAMCEGGSLRITTCTAAEGPDPRGAVEVAVEDDGCGIPAEDMDRIFDPFFTTKEPGKGTGLGLSAAYGIVRGHGGRIHAESDPGRGSRFVVRLPAGKKN